MCIMRASLLKRLKVGSCGVLRSPNTKLQKSTQKFQFAGKLGFVIRHSVLSTLFLKSTLSNSSQDQRWAFLTNTDTSLKLKGLLDGPIAWGLTLTDPYWKLKLLQRTRFLLYSQLWQIKLHFNWITYQIKKIGAWYHFNSCQSTSKPRFTVRWLSASEEWPFRAEDKEACAEKTC